MTRLVITATAKGCTEMQQEIRDIIAETTKATPAVAGTIASVMTLNEAIMYGTGIYLVIQVAYLLRKWWREESDWAWLKRKGRRQ